MIRSLKPFREERAARETDPMNENRGIALPCLNVAGRPVTHLHETLLSVLYLDVADCYRHVSS